MLAAPKMLSGVEILNFCKTIAHKDTHEYLSSYHTIMETATSDLIGIIPYNIKKWLPLNSVLEANKARKNLLNMISRVIEARKGVSEKIYLVDMMLTAEPPLSQQQLEGNIFLFFLAGHETTASTLCWALKLLALYPDFQDKAREEVDRVLKGTHPNANNMKDLTYLEMVIKEVLRFSSPAAFVPSRVTTKDIQVGDVFIPKNTKIGYDIYTIHHHPDFWPNPEIFDPDRFDKDMKQHPYAYLPFSQGKRNCIGMNFSLIQQRVFLAMVLQKFKISTPDNILGAANIHFHIPQTANLVLEKR